MTHDPFIEGLRAIFSADDAPAPATISAKAGLDKSAIRKMLSGDARSPRLSSAIAIANALGTTVEEISNASFPNTNMHQSFREALEQALSASGRSLRELTTSAGVSYEKFKSLRQGKSLTTSVDDAVKISAAFGVSLDDFLRGKITDDVQNVPIVGKVGAGAKVPAFAAYEPGSGPKVLCPPGLNPQTVVAVEVEGDSMEPVYSSGDLLFYTRQTADGVPTEAIGRRCVCECEDGFGWVKQVRLGSTPGLFNLVSINPTADNQHNIKLKWAAPVKLHWPAELAQRID